MNLSLPTPARPASPGRPGRRRSASAGRAGRRTGAAALALVLAAALAACGEEVAPIEPTIDPAGAPAAADSLEVHDPWVRATVGADDTTMTAAFMVLDNTGDAEVTVTGARAEVAGRTELHEMAAVDGQMVMRQIRGGLVLAPGRGQMLQPGGSHVMLMELTEELRPGDELDLVLELSDGSDVEVSAPVKEFTEEAGHYHGDDGHGDDGHGDDGHGDDEGHDHGSHDHGDDGEGDEHP
ncbi:copper chaperone PCu(A)C [Nocardioides solisilvae]|uniref:copper chaperone PCu(A)C n=1 Tax=Nocardioides solisilvae TaxID=1542435 RepID=UPI001EF423F6|nr:copper chaperone PCu(A)C [Nocardioides solisilvae]